MKFWEKADWCVEEDLKTLRVKNQIEECQDRTKSQSLGMVAKMFRE